MGEGSWYRDLAAEHATRRAKRTKASAPPRFVAGPQTDGLVPVLDALRGPQPQTDWNAVLRQIRARRM